VPFLTFERLARMIGGEVISGADIVSESVVIDSRELRPGSVFFAIRGDRLDGHSFLGDALAKGVGAVVERVPDPLPEGQGMIRVADTTVALQSLARSIRREYPFLLIGITGSAGKTTTKEMIAALIASEKQTWKSWGNFNNLIGCPLCIDNTPDGTEVVVSEMGMNHKGEIEQLARLTLPNIGVYTNIRPVHLEFFGTLDNIAAAKRELLENLAPDGSIVINADDSKVMMISESFPGRSVLYAVNAPADYRATDVVDRGLLGTRFTLAAENTTRTIDLALPGRHNMENLLAAIATARTVGISWNGIEGAIAGLKPAYHRGVVIPWRGATLYDDTYNSNPYALQRALELLAQAEVSGRRIAVVGDMLELGPDELKFHYEAGEQIPKNVGVIIGVGRRARSILDGARDAGFSAESVHHFDDAATAGPFVRDLIGQGDLVLLKGSRGVGLDRIVSLLETER
jgi:UDP-N-acetylmuramoyl-tripeptide--D-alanyl-D-alanine ligase